MTNRSGIIGIAAAMILIAAATVPGCDEKSPTSVDPAVSWARLENNVVVIDDDSPITLDHVDDSTYVFSIIKLPPEIEEGDIIIGSDGAGYVRSVTGVESTREHMFIHTKSCGLTAAVISGGTELTSSIGFGSDQLSGAKSAMELAPSVSSVVGGVALSGISLFDGEIGGQTASIRIDEGFIEYNPEVAIGLGLAEHEVRMFHYMTECALSYRFEIAVEIPAESVIDGELRLASARRRIVHRMGIVPITAIIELELLLAWEFSGSYAGDCATGFAGEYAIAAGGDYSAGVWADIASVEPSLTAGALRCVAYAETSGFRLAIKPVLTVELFGETAAVTRNSAGIGFTAHTPSPPVWDWSIFCEYADSCLLIPECLGAGPESYCTAGTQYDETIRTGPYRTDYYIFERLWGSEGSDAGQFSYPRGAAADTDGNIYVADSRNSRIQKFAPDSTLIVKWGREGMGDGQFVMPTGVAVDGAGCIYVTDSGNHRIQKFAPDTAFVTSWGIRGNGPGEFESPTGISAGPYGNIYVADTGNNRVQKFSPAGAYLTEWGEQGSDPGQFDTPRGIAADPGGNVYVTGCRNNRVQRFSSEGVFLDSWGSYGTDAGLFDCPIAVTVDGAGDVYILDYGNNRLQKFTPSGDFVTLLGSGGTGEGEFDRPEGTVTGNAGAIFIVDSRNSRIQKFAPIQ